MTTKTIGEEISNVPWEERPSERDIIWRSRRNPIIPRNLLANSNSIFNSAVVPFQENFAGVFRCDNKARDMHLHCGFSENGIDWKINEEPIAFSCEDSEIKYERGYDPRVCFIEDRYYISWCNLYHNRPTIGLAYTFDFKKFYQLENALLPFNRNGVLFPRKINGKYALLSRPSDNSHTPFGDIYYSESPDLTYWGRHRLVMEATTGWQSTKIGAGPIPIETEEGWLLLYHGVLNSCNGFVYSFGVALLDRDEPWKVIRRSSEYLMSPQELYECVGDVPNVVFPCAALCDAPTGRIAIYYGAADTVVALAFTTADNLLQFVKSH
jgi:beta-1,4-mannooligosaccharide/beta-1,4-mannosyl-N-acetylglucosamine phosphorylase